MSNQETSPVRDVTDPLGTVVSPGVMEGQGAYNRNSRLQASGIEKALPFLATAAQKVALETGTQSLVVADYGCSQGANSLVPIKVAIRNLRPRLQNGRAISIFHVDQPLNDFNCLIEVLSSHPKRYSLDEPNVFPNVIGRSFYEQVLPSESVHLGWSSYAAIWLSRVPSLIADHIFPPCATGEVRVAFERQAAEDWQTFLSMRSREMRHGARLVVVLPTTRPRGSYTFTEFMNVANIVLREMVDDGAITAAERARMVLLSYPRRKDELLAPFGTDGQFQSLVVEECEAQLLPNPGWLDYQRDGDAEALARTQAAFFRAVFTPSLAAALDSIQQRNFADQLQERMVWRLTADPMPANTAVQTIVLAKSAPSEVTVRDQMVSDRPADAG